MDHCFNNAVVRAICGGLLLMLSAALAEAQVGSIYFDGHMFVRAIADTKGGDHFVEFRLQGQSNDNWTRRVVFHSFPDSGNDVKRGVGNMIKWIKERDPKVRFGLIENNSGEVIVDFLLSPGVSDDVTFSCLRYTRAPDGKGLIALQYDERFQLGQVDGDDVKALRKRAIDAMAKFEMSEVKAWYAHGK
jgi:hypothetical protein